MLVSFKHANSALFFNFHCQTPYWPTSTDDYDYVLQQSLLWTSLLVFAVLRCAFSSQQIVC